MSVTNKLFTMAYSGLANSVFSLPIRVVDFKTRESFKVLAQPDLALEDFVIAVQNSHGVVLYNVPFGSKTHMACIPGGEIVCSIAFQKLQVVAVIGNQQSKRVIVSAYPNCDSVGKFTCLIGKLVGLSEVYVKAVVHQSAKEEARLILGEDCPLPDTTMFDFFKWLASLSHCWSSSQILYVMGKEVAPQLSKALPALASAEGIGTEFCFSVKLKHHDVDNTACSTRTFYIKSKEYIARASLEALFAVNRRALDAFKAEVKHTFQICFPDDLPAGDFIAMLEFSSVFEIVFTMSSWAYHL